MTYNKYRNEKFGYTNDILGSNARNKDQVKSNTLTFDNTIGGSKRNMTFDNVLSSRQGKPLVKRGVFYKEFGEHDGYEYFVSIREGRILIGIECSEKEAGYITSALGHRRAKVYSKFFFREDDYVTPAEGKTIVVIDQGAFDEFSENTVEEIAKYEKIRACLNVEIFKAIKRTKTPKRDSFKNKYKSGADKNEYFGY